MLNAPRRDLLTKVMHEDERRPRSRRGQQMIEWCQKETRDKHAARHR